jgi:hypothetical protein
MLQARHFAGNAAPGLGVIYSAQSFENGARDAYQEFRYPNPIDNSELIRGTFWVVDKC